MVLSVVSDTKLPLHSLPLLLEHAENEHIALQKMVHAHVNKNKFY
jgi:hypothetical protein